MRWLVLLVADVALMLLATFFALLLRENFEIAANRLAAFLPYLLATFASAFAVFPLAGLNRFVWRFSSFHDHMVVTGAVAVAATATAGLAFAYNRLDGVARSLPFLQFLTGTALLIGARVLHRLAHEFSHDRKAAPAMLRPQLHGNAGKIVIGVGELLRRLRLDELPQLFIIIRGDMSFIGPRPLLSQDQSPRPRFGPQPQLTPISRLSQAGS
jgi:FlaA1/EpsC-like NDP-sugar epimerase